MPQPIVDERLAGQFDAQFDARFDALADLAPIGLCRRDATGTPLSANSAWRRAIGIGDAAPSREVWREAIHPEDRARVVAAWDKASSLGRIKLEYRTRRPDGAMRWVAEGAVAERDAAGSISGFLGTLVDITDTRELATRLERSRRLEALGHLTGGVAHDFNNLLMIVLANAEILEELAERDEAIPPERLRRIARTMLNAAERGAGLTRTLLGFARGRAAPAGGLEANTQLAALGDMLRRSLGGSVTLVFDLAAEADVIALDPAQFDTAILNLALNARDAMPEGGTVTIATADTAAGILLSVADTGSGMTPDIAARAVEPFFSHDRPATRSGLGLSIVQNVAEQAGGALRIDTADGRGTTVTLTLPARPRPAAQATASRPPTMLGMAGRRVLVVDDIAPVLAVMADQVERLGFAVATAGTAEAALARLESGERFDLLLADIELGTGRDGVSLAREARERFSGMKVLLATGNPLGPTGEGLPDDVGPVLLKPFSLRQLADAVRSALAS